MNSKKCLCAEFVDAMVNLDNMLEFVSDNALCDITDSKLLEIFKTLNVASKVVSDELVNRGTDDEVEEPKIQEEEEKEKVNIKIKFTNDDGNTIDYETECKLNEVENVLNNIQNDSNENEEEFVDVNDEKELEVLDKLNIAIDEIKDAIEELSKNYDEETIAYIIEGFLEEIDKKDELTENDTIAAYSLEDFIFNDKIERPMPYVYGKSYIVKTTENNVYYLHKPLFTHYKNELCLKTIKAVTIAGSTNLNGPGYVPVSRIAEINFA
jgi:cobalamin biosynthesis protein CobT